MSSHFERISPEMETLAVPQFDFSAIQARAVARSEKRRRTPVLPAALAAVMLPVLAAAAAHFIPLQITHRVGNWQLWGPDKTFLHPKAADFSRLAREAPYHVVWPAGVPRAHKLLTLSATGSEVFVLAYSCPQAAAHDYRWIEFVIIPKPFDAVNRNLGKWFTSQMASHRENAFWDVGDESVFLGADCLTDKQIDDIRASTIAAGGVKRRQ